MNIRMIAITASSLLLLASVANAASAREGSNRAPVDSFCSDGTAALGSTCNLDAVPNTGHVKFASKNSFIQSESSKLDNGYCPDGTASLGKSTCE